MQGWRESNGPQIILKGKKSMKDDILYHFTSLDTFINIIKNDSFLLFDIKKSNDPLEGKFSITVLEKALNMLSNNEEIDDEFCKSVTPEFIKFRKNIEESQNDDKLITASCFCTLDHELSLWRSYGDDGKGVAIGVAQSVLEEIRKKEGFQFKKIKYLDESEYIDCAKKFWHLIYSEKDKYIEAKKNWCTPGGGIGYEDIPAYIKLRKKLHEFYMDGFFIKEKPNSDENEYRLLYSQDMTKYILPGIATPEDVNENVDGFVVNNVFKLFYKLSAKKKYMDSKQLINDVLLGPKCEASVNEIKMFLCKYEINVNAVKTSDVHMQ